VPGIVGRVKSRTLLVTAGWIGAAVLAVLVGLGAINVIGAGLTTREVSPRSEADVARALQDLPPAAASATPSIPATSKPADPISDPPSTRATRPPADPPATSSTREPPATTGTGDKPSPKPSVSTRTFPTRGGTVVGRCVGGRPEIVSMSPNQGFELHEQDRGVQDGDAEGEFRSVSDNHDRVKFEVACSGGAPGISVRAED
jgi:hypothetical protein